MVARKDAGAIQRGGDYMANKRKMLRRRAPKLPITIGEPKKKTARGGPERSAQPARPSDQSKTKGQACLDLLARQGGASIKELQSLTGWQPHSVRGYLAGTVKKKLGLNLTSEKSGDGSRRYCVDHATA